MKVGVISVLLIFWLSGSVSANGVDIDYLLSLDVSGSMCWNYTSDSIEKPKIEWAQDAARELVDTSGLAQGLFGTFPYDCEYNWTWGWNCSADLHYYTDFTSEHKDLTDAINSIECGGLTPIWDNIYSNTDKLLMESDAKNKYMILADVNPYILVKITQ